MQIIYDNIIFSLQKAGGISIYWYELIKRLQHRKDVTFFEYPNENIFRKKFTIETTEETQFPVRWMRYLPFLKRVPEKSVFHSSYYRVSLQKNIVNITTVHDFTYEYFRKGPAKYIHQWQKSFAIKKSDGIICVSENTKKDLLRFYPKIDEGKIKVIYNGVGEEFQQLTDPRAYLSGSLEALKGKKYILYIGDRSGYKNFHIAVKVLEALEDFSLVLVGGGDLNRDEVQSLQKIAHRMFHFQGIDAKILNIVYNNAFCLLYPSGYEGFGIPIAEAMKAGCPVVSTNVSSIPEVAGDSALLVKKIETGQFLNAIRMLQDRNFREAMIEKGLKQSEKFSWNNCFDQTCDFYEKIWQRKFN